MELLKKVLSSSSGVESSEALLERLCMDRHQSLSVHYAPVEHVTTDARVVILGITPGQQQAIRAIERAVAGLKAGLSAGEILRSVKSVASFAGPMRKNLVALLDKIALNRHLGVESCASFWLPNAALAHFTSCLQHPVLVEGRNYSGSPAIMGTPWLRRMALEGLRREMAQLRQDVLWVPLGEPPTKVLLELAQCGDIAPERVLAGLPHPSGANAERIAVFLGTKSPGACSAKTNGAKIIELRDRLTSQVSMLASREPH